MSVNNLSYGKDGLALTQSSEGCKLTAYQDVVGVWTIGYGHTGRDVYQGLTITQNQATALLLQDVQTSADCVNRLVAVSLQQDEFDALVDFVFNVGTGNFSTSTLLRLLNAGDFEGAAGQFERWDKAGGRVIAGLLRRRQAEEALFRQGMQAKSEVAGS